MLKLLLGDPNARKLKRYQPIVSDINLLEEEIAPLSDDELRARTASFQERLADAGTLTDATLCASPPPSQRAQPRALALSSPSRRSARCFARRPGRDV